MRWPDIGIGGSGERARLAELRHRPLNFDTSATDGPGWLRDDYRQRLPSEPPGPPVAGGSFEAADRLSRAYAFADPALVEARFDPDVPLEQRDMLLVLHALGLRIYAGVRVGAAGDETREVDGRTAQVSYWNYQTLEGHVEAGRRDYEVWKWLDTGEVEFRTHAVSRVAEATPLVRLGFRLLGRHKQVEFGRRACLRMALLTAAALRRGGEEQEPTTFDGRLLAVWLRDHHALLVGCRQLAGRMRGASRSPEERAFGEELARRARDDLAALDALLDRVGSGPPRLKDAGVAIGERVGRLKLNGRVARASPLASVVELEGSRFLLEGSRALWSGLANLALGPDDADERARAAAGLLETAESLRLAALDRAIRPPVAETS